MRNTYPFCVLFGALAHYRLARQAAKVRGTRKFERKQGLVRAPRLRKQPTFARRWVRHVLPSPLTLLAMMAVLAVLSTPAVMAGNMAYFGKNTEIGCLALNSYRERAIAGKEFPQGSANEELMAFAVVVENRLDVGFHQNGHAVPQNRCDVVWAKDQYSWTAWRDEVKFTITDKFRGDFYRAFKAAAKVMAETPDAMAVKAVVGDADHYVNLDRAQPRWTKAMQAKGEVGYHAFFTETGRFGEKRALNEAFAVMGMK